MFRDTYQEIARCLNFTDNWQEGEHVKWDNIYLDEKVVASYNSAHHRRKFCTLEDACNKQWKAGVMRELNIWLV